MKRYENLFMRCALVPSTLVGSSERHWIPGSMWQGCTELERAECVDQCLERY